MTLSACATATAQAASQTSVIDANTTPTNSIVQDVAANCGSKLVKKIAVFGLPRLLSSTPAETRAGGWVASPALAATAHASWPLTTPTAVQTPRRLPPTSVLRIVRAVSYPSVRMTASETPRNAARCAAPIVTRR
jgi:hypothetical protein